MVVKNRKKNNGPKKTVAGKMMDERPGQMKGGTNRMKDRIVNITRIRIVLLNVKPESSEDQPV